MGNKPGRIGQAKKDRVNNRGLHSAENGKLGGRPRKWNGEKIEELADSLDEWIADAMQNRNEFWWWDWCFDVGLTPQKVQILAERSDRFRESVEKAKAWQESIVARFALTKKFSDNFSRFFLLSSHGSDKWKQPTQDTLNASTNLAELLRMLSDKKISEEAFLKLVSGLPGVVTQSNDTPK